MEEVTDDAKLEWGDQRCGNALVLSCSAWLGLIGGAPAVYTEPEAPPATSGSTARDGNRLADSANLYLLLHAYNPVDWYPWGPEALEKARRENKPIFLSVRSTTCYWCHVAEQTICSDPDSAQLMNQWYVSIKVDREERADLDHMYMLATQLMTGHGGWRHLRSSCRRFLHRRGCLRRRAGRRQLPLIQRGDRLRARRAAQAAWRRTRAGVRRQILSGTGGSKAGHAYPPPRLI